MSTSTPAPSTGSAPEPASPAPFPSDDDYSPLLDLLQRFPGFFETYVLERLDPTARASLARTGSAFWDVVFPRSIFSVSLRARGRRRVGPRVFKLVDFLAIAHRLAWANGCPWVAQTRVVKSPLGEGTWRGCSGRGSTAARGIRGRVISPLRAGTWRYCGGRGSKAVRGMSGRLTARLQAGTWTC